MKKNPIFYGNSVECKYDLLRNITSDTQKSQNVHVYVAVIGSDQLLDIPDEENVRQFIGDGDKLKGRVHNDISNSLAVNPDTFSLLNGGITVICHSIRVDSDSNKIMLVQPSIINGSQTRGVMKIYHNNSDNKPVPAKVEIIVTTDDDLIADISISRNVQNKVKDYSIAGRKGAFENINNAIKKANLDDKYLLAEKESDKLNIDPVFFLQIGFLLMPKELWSKYLPTEKYSKNQIYSSTAKWLRIYVNEIFEKFQKGDEAAIELMKYFEDISVLALDLYYKWQKSQEFKGSKIKLGITRNVKGEIIKVSNAFVFPILAAHSVWISKNELGKYSLKLPRSFDPKKLVEIILGFWEGDVNKLGKNGIVYTQAENIAVLL
jgi:hypothetical protein